MLNTDAGRQEGRQVGVGKICVHHQTENCRCLGAQLGMSREFFFNATNLLSFGASVLQLLVTLPACAWVGVCVCRGVDIRF